MQFYRPSAFKQIVCSTLTVYVFQHLNTHNTVVNISGWWILHCVFILIETFQDSVIFMMSYIHVYIHRNLIRFHKNLDKRLHNFLRLISLLLQKEWLNMNRWNRCKLAKHVGRETILKSGRGSFVSYCLIFKNNNNNNKDGQ